MEEVFLIPFALISFLGESYAYVVFKRCCISKGGVFLSSDGTSATKECFKFNQPYRIKFLIDIGLRFEV